jgi:hypothetical protein
MTESHTPAPKAIEALPENTLQALWAETLGYDGGLQTFNANDLLLLSRAVESAALAAAQAEQAKPEAPTWERKTGNKWVPMRADMADDYKRDGYEVRPQPSPPSDRGPARPHNNREDLRETYEAVVARSLAAITPPSTNTASPPVKQFAALRSAFRTTEAGLGEYRMIFKFRNIADLHKADDEWRGVCTAPPQADRADAERIENLLAELALETRIYDEEGYTLNPDAAVIFDQIKQHLAARATQEPKP